MVEQTHTHVHTPDVHRYTEMDRNLMNQSDSI